MRVLIIGGAGYIGSHVVKAMLEAGHSVTVFDNMSTGQLCNIFPGTEFIAGDTRHGDDIDAAFARGFDGAVYLAAYKAVGESMLNPEKYSINNISATMNILNAAVKHGCLRFVFSSSAAVYGSPEYLPIDEKHPKNPESYYGFTKLKTEEFLQWYDRLKGLKSACLRYFNAAGYDPSGAVAGLERNPQNLLPIIMEVAAGMRKELCIFGNDYPTRDGTCIRDYVHVSDLAQAHTDALRYIDEKNTSLTVNLGTGTGITVNEMLKAAREVTGKPIPARFVGRRAGDPAELYATSHRACETIGWDPKYSDAKTLIESTWNMYKKQCCF